jgi:deoxycytidylate deaminase
MSLLKNKYEKKIKMLLEYNENLSTCAYVKVGAVLVTTNGKILAEGYNGTPSDIIQCNEIDKLLEILSTEHVDFRPIYDEIHRIVPKEQISTKITADIVFNILLKHLKGELARYIANLRTKYVNKPKTLKINGYILYRQIELLLGVNDYTIFEDKEQRRLYNYVHSRLENHAEKNLIQTAKIFQIKELEREELILFCTKTPCFECYKYLREVFPSIKEIRYKSEYIDKKYNDTTLPLLEADGIIVKRI